MARLTSKLAALAFFALQTPRLALATPVKDVLTIGVYHNGNWSNLDWGYYSGGQLFYYVTTPSNPVPFHPNNDVNLQYNADISRTTNGVNLDVSSTINNLYLGGVSLNVLADQTLNTAALTGTGNVYVGDRSTLNAALDSYAGTIFSQSGGNISTVGVTGTKIGGSAGIYLDAIGANSIDRLVGFGQDVTNYGTIAGSGHVFNIGNLKNYGTVNAAGIAQPILYIQATSFDNSFGFVEAQAGKAVRIESAFANYVGGNTLQGGTYDLAGLLIVPGMSNISTIAAGTNVTLRGNGYITDGHVNSLYNLSNNAGQLMLLGGNSSSFGGSLTNNGTIIVDSSTLTSAGFQNQGSLFVTSGTADFRTGGTDTLLNLDAATETLTGGLWQLGAGGKLKYDAGTGAHGGEIVNIGAGTMLSIAAVGQLQYGPMMKDALAELTGNAGTFVLTGGSQHITPLGGTLTNQGLVEATGGGSLVVIGGIMNSGTLSANSGGRLLASLALNNTGSVSVDAGMFSSNNTINSGDYSVTNGGTASVSSLFENRTGGTVTVGSGGAGAPADQLTGNDFLNNGGTVTINASGTVMAASYTQSGETTILASGTILAPQTTVQGGTLQGAGLISGNAENSGGTFAPSGALLEVQGNFVQDAGGMLSELFGSGGYLRVDGNLMLDGVFMAMLAPGTSAQLGDSFEAVRFLGSLTGDFGSTVLPTLGAGLAWRELVSANDITFNVVAANPTPEPSFAALAGVLLVGIGVAGRKKRRS